MSTPAPAVLQIDDTTDTTPLRHDGDAAAAGDVGAGRVLNVRGALTVEGDVRAATLSVGGAATIRGAIAGAPTSRYSVSGAVQCRAISGGTLTTQAGVRVAEHIDAARLTCCGRLDVGGNIRGSDVAANGGVTCASLGTPEGHITLIEAGEGRTMQLLTQAAEARIKADRADTTAARMKIGEMLANPATLSPQDREQVTEMLAGVDEDEAKVAKLVAAFERRKRLVTQQADARIAVKEVVHAGVRIRMGGIEVAITKPITGPVTFLKRTHEGQIEIIAVNDSTGVVTVIATGEAPAIAA